LKRQYHLENIGIEGRIILKWNKETGYKDMDWVPLAQDRVQWQAIVNIVNEPLGFIKSGEFLD